MPPQIVQFVFDKDATWHKVKDRLSVFLDTNCWVELTHAKDETARRVRERLKALVASGRVFCPVSWGILEELLKQSGESLQRRASLTEELSLNACFVNREELYAWELDRSVRRLRGEPAGESGNGLFVPPAAFVGSGPCLVLYGDTRLSPEAQESAQAFMKRNLSKIGIRELAEKMGGRRLNEKPPAYSTAAKWAKEKLNGDKRKLFLEEAGNSFRLYITPLVLRYPPQVATPWAARFGPPEDEEAWISNALAKLPALHNYIEIMVAADLQPDRKDKYNHFLDNEIVVAPLAYADVFASNDRAVKDLLQNRTGILRRSKCHFCENLSALDRWLTDKATK